MDWADSARDLDSYLRLRTFPLAFKLFASADALDQVRGIRRLDYKPRLCQLITLARVHGWTLGATAEELGSPVCASIIGLIEPPQELIEGKTLSGIMYKTAQDARKHEKAVPRLPTGKYQAVAIAPLKTNKFEPDLVLVYGNPAQIFMLVAAFQWRDFETLDSYCIGESSCSDAIVRGYLSHKPAIALPSYAERRYGQAQDDEMVIALPTASVAKVLEGLKGLYQGGIRYPIPSWGAQVKAPSLLDQEASEEP
ncbi:MAG: DUF169 domain-containing protein [Dehalococcoidia bacterium]|jgi:uncharacterized protein (DUF169 family)